MLKSNNSGQMIVRSESLDRNFDIKYVQVSHGIKYSVMAKIQLTTIFLFQVETFVLILLEKFVDCLTDGAISQKETKRYYKIVHGKVILGWICFLYNYSFLILIIIGSSQGVKSKVPDCSLEISLFEPQSCCYIHFQTYALEKDMKSLIHLTMS